MNTTYKGLQILFDKPNPSDRGSHLFGMCFMEVLRADGYRIDSDYYQPGQETSVLTKKKALIDYWDSSNGFPSLFGR